jgi:MerR family transcriptional regulator, heat shock protein HspR
VALGRWKALVAADWLDDPDYPAYTTRRAAVALGVQQAFLRALDAAGALSPERSGGGHRRYTRRQLAFAGRIRELFDQGHSLASALRILGLQDDVAGLQDDLAAERALTASLQRQLGREQDHGRGTPPTHHAHGGRRMGQLPAAARRRGPAAAPVPTLGPASPPTTSPTPTGSASCATSAWPNPLPRPGS